MTKVISHFGNPLNHSLIKDDGSEYHELLIGISEEGTNNVPNYMKRILWIKITNANER